MSRPEIIDTPAGPALLKRSHRKTLAISVLPDGTLELVAPGHASVEAILQRVEKRRRWIKEQRRQFAEMNATRPALRYVSGATHRYLGKQYRLKVAHGPESSVKMLGGWLHVTVHPDALGGVQKALDQWFRKRAEEQFQKRLQPWEEWCRRRGLPVPRLKIQRMSRRWGSALSDGLIRLNPELIHAPSACIDYVIAHEVCHLRHPDHGPKFQMLLKQLVPGWEAVKARLERA